MYRFPLVESNRAKDGVECTVLVPDDCPFFAGHFPGRPVLPAIAHLAMVIQLSHGESMPEASLAGIDRISFHLPIGPGTTVSVRISDTDSRGRSRFTIESRRGVSSRGTLSWSAREAPQEQGGAEE